MSRSGAPIYEHEIQRIWAEQDFDLSELKTVDGKKLRFFLQAGGTKARVPILRLPGSPLVMIFSTVPLKSIFRVRDGKLMDITGIRPTTR